MSKVVHVAVAVIVKDAHVLIAKRADDAHQGGLWEFPGGKVEAGESIVEALYREIQEELGLRIKDSRPLIKLEYHYPDKSVVLETRLVSSFAGKEYSFESHPDKKQYGLENQLVKWIPFRKLDDYQFPAANQAILNALNLPEQYLITPDCSAGMESVEQEEIKQFIKRFSQKVAENPLVQLRLPSHKLADSLIQNESSSQTLYQQLCRISEQKNALLLLNSSMLQDRLSEETFDLSERKWQQMALAAGIHLNSRHLYDDTFVTNYRQRFSNKKIAASCHSEKDIIQANKLGIDFIVLSPVQQTESHPEQEAMGWEAFESLVTMAEMPVYALGGMRSDDVSQAQEVGGQGIAAIRSLWQ
ncbi:Nudix family hydrolase [sulfur-oxidizing endosymbiont of Gigantopelta aegis]|uniref:Nudix family hydrolase n=1 Tax=sulfur-oxidizing endosymbiont of Gigantopelta aegis TaxID=2794934 RepID=UPI0018DD58CC|nr:Nudix family hydrolase [sulfur-oxidizing endosymbiont of Gigantopelta aegis]